MNSKQARTSSRKDSEQYKAITRAEFESTDTIVLLDNVTAKEKTIIGVFGRLQANLGRCQVVVLTNVPTLSMIDEPVELRKGIQKNKMGDGWK
uniref:Uncharacterized protein n=1 Tax=Vespula pensylvanica TaxID=30213 RepID=A0A834P5J2_VESPE|nr:hypothetical protein H0235_005739 [Vespula pensylvanica]